jgi:hypothetical protein
LIKTIFEVADFGRMKTFLLLLLSLSLFGEHIYEKKMTKENFNAMDNGKIKCRLVCDKKIYKEQKISEAISFYKNSKLYKFTKKF